MTSKYFKTSIYLLPSLRRRMAGATAGRIISTVTRRSSQYTATAAAPVTTVARTNMATFTKTHMSAFLPVLRTWLGQCAHHRSTGENKRVTRSEVSESCGGRNTPWGLSRTGKCQRNGASVWCCRESEVVYWEEDGSDGSSYARGETQNADQPRTSHRTHPRYTHLCARQLDDHFRADHDPVGHPVRAAASAVDAGAALGRGRRHQLALFCLSSFP